MKKFNKLLCFMGVFISVVAAFCTMSFAATVGKPLPTPEEGWQRFNDSDTRIKFSNSPIPYTYGSNNQYFWQNDIRGSGADGNIQFQFYGTKLRIISNYYSGNDPHVSIIIDGHEESFSEYTSSSSQIYKALVYEKSGLFLGRHSVFMYAKKGAALDAIDIDATGYLVDINVPNSPTNLTATPGNKKVDLSWDAVDGATSYNVKRSETAGGPYQTIVTTTTGAITYTDTGLQNGTTYYYVVSAVNAGGESPNSNEASATPTALQPTNQLKLVLEVNQEKQLSVSDELSDNTEMDWISSDPSIAAVDANGRVKALNPGTTVITCTSKDKSYTESINVLVVDLEYQLAVDLNIGGTCRLTIDDLKNTTFVTWSSYNPAIAAVSAKGKVTAVSEGLTYITATDKDGKEIGRIYIGVRQ